eukprot:m.197717 g.197717  ORF g.197717 m.197717 type:complete len:95 (+) comp53769_c0_seq16:66-350(+)
MPSISSGRYKVCDLLLVLPCWFLPTAVRNCCSRLSSSTNLLFSLASVSFFCFLTLKPALFPFVCANCHEPIWRRNLSCLLSGFAWSCGGCLAFD